MPRTCSVCRSPHRVDVEQAILNGDSLRVVAQRFGLSHMAIQRHMTRCAVADGVKGLPDLPPPPPDKAPKAKKAKAVPAAPPEEPKNALEGFNAYAKIQGLMKNAEALREHAAKTQNAQLELWAIAEARKTAEAMVKTFEAEKRIEALYAPKETFSASVIYEYLQETHPEVLAELMAYLKEAHQG